MCVRTKMQYLTQTSRPSKFHTEQRPNKCATLPQPPIVRRLSAMRSPCPAAHHQSSTAMCERQLTATAALGEECECAVWSYRNTRSRRYSQPIQLHHHTEPNVVFEGAATRYVERNHDTYTKSSRTGKQHKKLTSRKKYKI